MNRHDPIDIDQMAKRMSKTKGIGIPSPNETVQSVIHGSKIKVRYDRPFRRGRKIFGGVVPYDSVWRTGAGGPTQITLDNNIKVGKTIIPKGAYSLYSIPKPNEWLLIFNLDLETWPTDPDRSEDFAKVSIPVKRTEIIRDQFTIEVQETKKGGELTFYWDDVSAILEFEIIKK